MKRVISIFCFCIFLCYSTSNYAYKKKRYNKVYFVGDVHSVSFKMDSHCITPHQPFDNPVNIRPTTQFGLGLNVVAGRHLSKETAKCLAKQNDDMTFLWADHFTYNKNPTKLNFAIQGTLTINGVSFDDIILAQGHHQTVNDWWFGGRFCSHASANPWDASIDSVNCQSRCGQETWCFIRGASDTGVGHMSPHRIKVVTHPCHTYDPCHVPC